jgi:hypothetical protein
MNPLKWSLMRFGHLVTYSCLDSGKDRLRFTLNGMVFTECDSLKVLGVKLDSNLTFSDHVSYICRVVTCKLRKFNILRYILPESAKLELVHLTIFPSIFYAIRVFGNSPSRQNPTLLAKLQNSL